MDERIAKVLNHRATLPTLTGVVGLAVGAVAGYWRAGRQFTDLQNQIDKLNAESDKILAEAERANNVTEATIESEVNRRVKDLYGRMVETMGYDSETQIIEDEQGLIHLREDHPAFDDEGKPRVISSARIMDISIRTDGGGLPGTGIISVEPVIDTPSHEHTIPYTGYSEPIGTITEVRETDDGIEAEGIITDPERFEEVTGQSVTHNVFDNGGDEWDYKTERENRDTSKPYVIHVDEYVADEMGWDSQSTLTYFEGDDILCDTHDTPMFNYQEAVGEIKDKFGHGSNDPNVVYVRNEKLECEFEILRNPDSYQMVVLNEQMNRRAQVDDLRHSATHRFRPD